MRAPSVGTERAARGGFVRGTAWAIVLLTLSLIVTPTLVLAQNSTSLPPATSGDFASPTPTSTLHSVSALAAGPSPTTSDPYNLYGAVGEADPYVTDPAYANASSAATINVDTTFAAPAPSGAALGSANITESKPTHQLPTIPTWAPDRTVINYTVPAMSPMLNFSSRPNATDIDDDWLLTYSDVSWMNYVNGSIGLGTPTQRTSTPNANVRYWFIGSAFYIKGTINGTITVKAVNTDMPDLDFTETEFHGDGTVNGTDEMSLLGDSSLPSLYNITITLVEGSFILEQLTVSAPLGGFSSRATRVTMQMLDNTDGISTAVNTIGEWTTTLTFCGWTWNQTSLANEQACSPESYPCATTFSENARLSFKAPANTSIFTIYGTLGSTLGPFQIGTADYDYDDQSQKYTAMSPWTRGNAPLYTGALDPRTQSVINIDHLSDPSGVTSFSVYKVVFYLAVGGYTEYDYFPSIDYPDGPSPLPKIIGGAVGGGVGFLLVVGGLLWFCLRRRRKKRQQETLEEKTSNTHTPVGRRRAVGQNLPAETESVFEVDGSEASTEGIGTVVTPLPPPETPSKTSPLAQISTTALLERKMREAREAHEASRTGSTLLYPSSTPLSPAGANPFHGDPNDPPTLPPLKLSLMTGDFLPPNSTFTNNSPSSPFANTTHTSSSSNTSPRKTSPLTLSSSPQLGHESTFGPGPSRHMPQMTVTEEEDAGRLPAMVAETVPPRYNPAWADEYTATGTVLDSTAGTLLASGPTTLAERQWAQDARESGSSEVLAHPSSAPVSPTDSNPAARSPAESTHRLVPSHISGSGSVAGSTSDKTSPYDSASVSPHSEFGPSVAHK